MNYVLADGTLEQLRAMLTIDGVEHASRGVRLLPDGRYRAGVYLDETAIPLIQAQGIIVTVVQSQADINARLQQVWAEQQDGNVA